MLVFLARWVPWLSKVIDHQIALAVLTVVCQALRIAVSRWKIFPLIVRPHLLYQSYNKMLHQGGSKVCARPCRSSQICHHSYWSCLASSQGRLPSKWWPIVGGQTWFWVCWSIPRLPVLLDIHEKRDLLFQLYVVDTCGILRSPQKDNVSQNSFLLVSIGCCDHLFF